MIKEKGTGTFGTFGAEFADEERGELSDAVRRCGEARV
jgi:hypothetical protein